jgi:hypothetical protein
VDFGTAHERIGRVEDDPVARRKARGDFHGVAKVVADGDRHKLDAVAADHTDTKAFGAE